MSYDLNKLAKLKAVQSLAATVKADQTKLNTLIGSDSGKSVRTIANEELAAQLIPATAQESLDTLQEIAAWIQSHPGDASAMNSRITTLEGTVGDATSGLVKDVDDLEGTVGDATSGLVKDVEDLKAVGSTKVEASETNGNIKIDGVETTVYTEPNDVVHGAIATDAEVTEMLAEIFAA